MKRSKDKFYMKQIFDCISDGEIIATGKIAKEIGLSEKSVRNRLNELSDFLLQNKLGEIQRKPRVGIWLEANENQKEEIQKILSDENLQVDYSSILAFFLLGCVFIAIGMFLSSLTESPVIAAITTCAALFFFYLLDNLLQYFPSSAISNLVIWIIIFALISLLIYHITKNQMIAGIVTGIGCIAGIIVYFVKKTLLESLFSTLLGHLVLTDIFYNFSQNYIFDLGGILTYLSLIILLVFLTVQTFEKRRWS